MRKDIFTCTHTLSSGWVTMAQSASKSCEICVSAPGSHYCLECEQYYCQNCKTLHQRQKISRNHQFYDASEVIPEGKSKCPDHQEEYNLMCNTCDIPVCTSCVTEKHNKHEFFKLVDIISKIRSKSEDNLRTKINEGNRQVNMIRKEISSFEDSENSAIKSINKEGKKVKEMVDKCVAGMVVSVQEQCKQEKEKLTKLLFATQSQLLEEHGLQKRITDLDKALHDANLVHELKTLNLEIEKLRVMHPPDFPIISYDTKSVTEQNIKHLIGTFTLR